MLKKAQTSSDPEIVRLHARWRLRRRLKWLFLGWFVIAFFTYGIGTGFLAIVLSNDLSMAAARRTASVIWLSVLAFTLVAFIIALVMQITAFRRLEDFRRKLRASPAPQ